MRSQTATEDDLSEVREKSITIRRMEIDDLAKVYRLGERLFTRAALPVLYHTWDPYEVTQYFNTDPEFCLVAIDEGGRVVGFALGYTVDKDGSPRRFGYLAWLGVKKEYQRLGVGTALLEAFEERMRDEGVQALLLDTEGGNQKALRFFQKHGFSRPTTHIWLTKSLSKRHPASPKPIRPPTPARKKKTRKLDSTGGVASQDPLPRVVLVERDT